MLHEEESNNTCLRVVAKAKAAAAKMASRAFPGHIGHANPRVGYWCSCVAMETAKAIDRKRLLRSTFHNSMMESERCLEFLISLTQTT
jgi:hypothetical protein